MDALLILLLLDAGDNLLLEKQENICNIYFMLKMYLRYKNEAFGFEKQPTENWFKNSFLKRLIKN